MSVPECVQCGKNLAGSHAHRKYCSPRCKGRWRTAHPSPPRGLGHRCRMCGTSIPIGPGQHNKWLCSDKCRRDSISKSVREFHLRQPSASETYHAKAKEKRLPDNNLVRFYRTNPDAPKACESCGERRVLDVAHRPECRRNGAWRSSKNCQWPLMVWVLCPTCHALVDRMHYPPVDLGLV